MRPMTPRWLLVPIMLAALTWRGPVEACSCAAPRATLLSSQEVPLNGQLVLRLPTGGNGSVVVREVFGGPEVPVSVARHPAGRATVAVVRAPSGWKADQRYELVFVDPSRDHPKRILFGSFTAGSNKDETAPKLTAPRAATMHDEVVMKGTSCQSKERWIEVEGQPATDDGEVFYAVWVAPAATKIPADAAPRWILPWTGDRLEIGGRSMCAWFKPDLPTKPGRYQVQIAAVDAAGHRSPRHRLSFTVK